MKFRYVIAIIAAAISIAATGANGPRSLGQLDPIVIGAVEREQQCLLSENEVVTLGAANGVTAAQAASRAGVLGKIVAGDNRFAIIEMDRSVAKVDFDDASLAPVFRSGRGADAPFLFPNGEVIVRFNFRADATSAADWGAAYGLTVVRPLAFADAFLFRASSPAKSLKAARDGATSDKVLFCGPNWTRRRVLRQTDPLYPYQWHLKNTGEVPGTVAGNDINVEPVWETYRGTPEQIVCAVDDGLEIAHKDLAANIVPNLSWDFVDNKADPTAGAHGTACAGVAAARGYNDIGVRGVAPETGLCGYRILGKEETSDLIEAEAETRACDRIAAYNNSWGPTDDGQRLEGPKPLTVAAMTQAIAEGRGGKGTVYVWAGGNGLTEGDNSNYDGYANWRYTIAVGASTSAGKQAYYSESGANLCVNAPSKGGSDPGVTTVDRSGSLGYNRTGEAQGDYPDLDFTNHFGGTSSAAPTVTGACALILQANPELGWRDVKKVLMTTASQNDPSDADWAINAAGYPVNHKYGFGRIDVAAAVEAAAAWTNLGPEVSVEGVDSPEKAIPLAAGGVSSVISLTDNLIVESVEIYFTADHKNWGDLNVILTAPSGTTSVLAERHDTSKSVSRYDNWRFGSERHLGEMASGAWTLTVRDLGTQGGGTFVTWKLVVYGTKPALDMADLTVSASPTAGGEVSPGGTVRLYKGLTTGAVATASPGYYFVEWVADPAENVTFGGGGPKAARAAVSLSGDARLTATFSRTPPDMAVVTFRAFPNAGGVPIPNGRTAANIGAGVPITAIGDAKYAFVRWDADPAENAEFNAPEKLNAVARILGNVTISAVFRPPAVDLTRGSVVTVAASDLGLDAFSRAPKVTGTIGTRAYALKTLGTFPGRTVTAIWPAKPRIYDPADYKNPPEGLGVLLKNDPMSAVSLDALLVDAKADGAKLDLAGLSACSLIPPVIDFVGGEFEPGKTLTLVGSFFGTKPPKVFVEYREDGKYRLQPCRLVKEFVYVDALGRPSAMDPKTGAGEINVLYPKLPAGAMATEYLVLENAAGMCSYSWSTGEKARP